MSPDRHPVEDYRVTPGMEVADLVDRMDAGAGFTAGLVDRAADVVNDLVRDDVTSFLSFPAAPVATGMRGVLAGMVRDGWVDAVVTTCGTLDHDLARVWRDYEQGAFGLDDRDLHDEGVHRLGNVLVPEESYGPLLEEKVRPWIEEMTGERTDWSTADLAAELGRRVRDVDGGEESLLAACHDRDVPVFVPAPTDGAVGSQIWAASQDGPRMRFDLLEDEERLADRVFGADELGALMVGGGVSKHHVIWWSQFLDGLDHAVYVTTAPEWDGSLSGARLEEGISWGKVKRDASIVNVPGEATVLVPLIYAAALG
jgi:deoxyhypusine synthase